MSGRKRDLVWLYYDELKNEGGRKGHRAKCKKCGHELEGQVSRLKKHIEKCKSGTVGTDSDDDGKYVNFIFFSGTSLEQYPIQQ